MKLSEIFRSLILAAASAIATAGCASGLLTAQVTPHQVITTRTVTQTNTVVQTNIVTQTLTNGVTVTNTAYVTNTTYLTMPVVVTNTVNVTNGYMVSSTASNVLADAAAANTLTGPMYPFAGTVGAILALATAGLGWYANLKTKQLHTQSSAAATIITAVEGLEPAAAAAVKAAVTAQTTKMGTNAAVQSVVGAVTQNLP